MNFYGLIIGLVTFFVIGIFHPIVIKGEYYLGKKIWPIFLVLGVIFLVASLYIKDRTISAIVGVVGFSCLWSIHEIIEQEERVNKGWFPRNPKKDKR
ncbi:protein of unknown function [Clostridium cavendishii DSM 21758]|uniref:DUF4491 domain-containing protein n=1 Tax=Clostridium cavendishii DSM 21758 TaxID=1121302 RepID=A0A1M6BCL8_9CLOT|nr:DUF4491 family protein [Clostridium cavendishii]SHI46308.1 protein of unknown function [Clostridium cavendishii DSM 21758]